MAESNCSEDRKWPEGAYHRLTAVRDVSFGKLRHASYGLDTVLRMLADALAADPDCSEHLDDNRKGGLISAALMCSEAMTEFVEDHEREDTKGRRALFAEPTERDPVDLRAYRMTRAKEVTA